MRGVTSQTADCRRRHKAGIGVGPLLHDFAQRQVDEELKQCGRYEPTYHGRGHFTVRLTAPELAASRLKAIASQRIEDTYFHTTIVSVRVTPDGNYLFLECECGYYRRVLTPCRHILCVKRGTFTADVDCFPTAIVLDCETLYPVMSFDIVSSSGPSLDGVLEPELSDIRACFGDTPPFVSPANVPIPPCDLACSRVVGVGGVGVMPCELSPLEAPAVHRESVSLLQQEERWRRSQLLAKMNPLVEAVASIASRMTVEGMDRTRYNATSTNLLDGLRSLIGQVTYMQSRPGTSSDSGHPVTTAIDTTTHPGTSTNPDMNLIIMDPAAVHHHNMSAQFRRHKDIVDVLQKPPKKTRLHNP